MASCGNGAELLSIRSIGAIRETWFADCYIESERNYCQLWLIRAVGRQVIEIFLEEFRMKKIQMVLGSWVVGGFSQLTMASGALVPVASQDVFVPKGFDDNDQIEVVLDGYLPNSCYQLDSVTKTIDEATKTITVQQMARVYPGQCLMALVPFTSEVKVGILSKGDYKIVTNRGNFETSLNVAMSTTAGPDDFLYAPVERTWIERAQDGSLTAVLEGRFTNTCMVFDEVKVIYSGKTIEVLPVMKMEDRTDCVDQQVPYRKMQALSFQLPGRYLLHVRSLNGQAVNTVFPVYENGSPIE